MAVDEFIFFTSYTGVYFSKRVTEELHTHILVILPLGIHSKETRAYVCRHRTKVVTIAAFATNKTLKPG